MGGKCQSAQELESSLMEHRDELTRVSGMFGGALFFLRALFARRFWAEESTQCRRPVRREQASDSIKESSSDWNPGNDQKPRYFAKQAGLFAGENVIDQADINEKPDACDAQPDQNGSILGGEIKDICKYVF
jgi:hypothetical protein